MHTRRRLHRIGAVIAGLTLSVAGAGAATASGTSVDPSTLVPVPPDAYVCSANGVQVYCTATVVTDFVNEPQFDVRCGTVYGTGRDMKSAKRWYVDGLIVEKRVHEDTAFTWSLSPTGGGTVLSGITHTNWVEQYAVPGDVTTNFGHQQGTDLVVRGPSGGVVWQISGQIHGEEFFTGHFMTDENPPMPITSPAQGDLCAAFGA
jgi:hypothetical protein